MNKARKRIGLLGVALCSLLAIPVYADRVDLLLGSAVDYDKRLFQIIGFGVDRRYPARRDGWSFVSMTGGVTSHHEGNLIGYTSVYLGRWRCSFSSSFGMDVNLGGGLGVTIATTDVGISFMPIVLTTINFNYIFANAMLLGIQGGFITGIPLVTLVFSLPIAVAKEGRR